MKYRNALFLIIFLVIIGISTTVNATPGNEDFRDDVFYEAIIEQLNDDNFNSISDRVLDYCVTDEELKSITTLSCGSMDNPVKDMIGIENLTNLVSLSIKYPQIYELNITNNIKLKYLTVLNANNLDEIDFSNNTELVSIDLTYTHLKNLNLTNCNELTYFSMGAGDVSSARVDELDLSNCKKLTTLKISGNKMKSIDLSENVLLEDVSITNGKLEKIILPTDSNIKILNIHSNRFESIFDIENIETCTNLKKVNIKNNNIEDYSILFDMDSITELFIEDNTEEIFQDEDKNEDEIIGEEQKIETDIGSEFVRKQVFFEILISEIIKHKILMLIFIILIIIFLYSITTKNEENL